LSLSFETDKAALLQIELIDSLNELKRGLSDKFILVVDPGAGKILVESRRIGRKHQKKKLYIWRFIRINSELLVSINV
jgi:hypothetical protein